MSTPHAGRPPLEQQLLGGPHRGDVEAPARVGGDDEGRRRRPGTPGSARPAGCCRPTATATWRSSAARLQALGVSLRPVTPALAAFQSMPGPAWGAAAPPSARCSRTSRPGTTASPPGPRGRRRRPARERLAGRRPGRWPSPATCDRCPTPSGRQAERQLRAARAGRCPTRRRRRPARRAAPSKVTSLDGEACRRCPAPTAVDHAARGVVARGPSARPAAAAATAPTIASTSSSSVERRRVDADEDHLPAAQHGDPVGDRPGLGELVGDDHDAEAVAAQLVDEPRTGRRPPAGRARWSARRGSRTRAPSAAP